MKEEKNIISNYKDDDHKIYVTKDSEIEELNEDKIKNNKEVFWKRKKRNENLKQIDAIINGMKLTKYFKF